MSSPLFAVCQFVDLFSGQSPRYIRNSRTLRKAWKKRSLIWNIVHRGAILQSALKEERSKEEVRKKEETKKRRIYELGKTEKYEESNASFVPRAIYKYVDPQVPVPSIRVIRVIQFATNI